MLAALFDFQNFDFVHEHSVRGDEILDASIPISNMRADFYLSFTAPSHAIDTVVDPRNDVPTADNDLAKMVFLNLLALAQPTVQTDLNGIAFLMGSPLPGVSERSLTPDLSFMLVGPSDLS